MSIFSSQARTDRSASEGNTRENVRRRRLVARRLLGATLMAFATLTIAAVQPRNIEAAVVAQCTELPYDDYVLCLLMAPDVWSQKLCDLEFFLKYAVCLLESST